MTYSQETKSGTPKPRFWILILVSWGLFIYAGYLNEHPIILF